MKCFRPLDGESISKPNLSGDEKKVKVEVSVP